MTRRTMTSTPVDHRQDRNKWEGFVALAHAAVAAEGPADLRTLSDRALAAETCWVPLAPFPRHLPCRLLSRIAWAYGRQTDLAERARYAPMLMTAAGMVDELLAATAAEQAATMPPAASDAPEAVTGRLPYRED